MSNEEAKQETTGMAHEPVLGEGKKYYRCGWCGQPCNENGGCLDTKDYCETVVHIEKNDIIVESVYGQCMMQVTREMALDAGNPELEGHWI